MSTLLTAPFWLPLLGAVVGLLARRHYHVQQAISLLVLVASVGIGGVLVAATADGAVHATQVGGWPVGIAIPFVADRFAALLITTTALVALLAVVFAMLRGEDHHVQFHPLVGVLVTGVFASFLTADLFNLFVTFEIMLMASYVLLTLRAGRAQERAGAVYVMTNLLASTAFLLGLALLYGRVGTVNLGELYGVAADPGAAVAAGAIAIAIGVKASLVPLHGWLPRAYVCAGPAVTALFSGLLTKVGVYALFRLYSVVYAGEPRWSLLLLVVAGVTMLVGVLGAVGKGDMRAILAFHMVSQVGYLVLPLGLWSLAGVTAGIVYLLQYIAVKGALFLAAGTVETVTGTGRLAALGGMLRTRPAVAIGFLLPALALAGVPPTSGFVGKFMLIRASFEGAHYVVGGVAVAVSFLTLRSMMKIWNGVFWGEPSEAVAAEAGTEGDPDRARLPRVVDGIPQPPPVVFTPPRVRALALPSLVVGVATILLGLGAQVLVTLAEPAAAGLLDPGAYLEAVRGR